MELYLHEKLTHTLLLEITNGSYRAGQRFLSLRKIRKTWRVSDPTVLNSLRTLVSLGLLEARARSGYFLTGDFYSQAMVALKKNKAEPLLPTLDLYRKLNLLGTKGSEIHKKRIAFLVESRNIDPLFKPQIYSTPPGTLCSPSVRLSTRSFSRECAKMGMEVDYLIYQDWVADYGEWAKAVLDTGKYGGVVVFCRRGYSRLAELLAAPIKAYLPIIVLYNNNQGVLPVNSIGLNNVGIGYDAITHLYRQGHRKIVVLSRREGHEKRVWEDRITGATLAAEELGLKGNQFQVLRIRRDPPNSPQVRRTFYNISRRPTAIFVCQSHVLKGLGEILNTLEIQVPRDLSVIGCSSRNHADICGVPLDVMNLSVAPYIGKLAMKQIIAIRNGEPLEKNTYINVRYKKRHSTLAYTPGS